MNFQNDYEVDGSHYKELARAELKAKFLLKKGFSQVLILKNENPFSVYYLDKKGNVCYSRF